MFKNFLRCIFIKDHQVHQHRVIDMNEVDADGNTALHRAAKEGDLQMMVDILGLGADLEIVNKEGFTAVELFKIKREELNSPIVHVSENSPVDSDENSGQLLSVVGDVIESDIE